MARIGREGLTGEIQSMGSEYDVFLSFRGPDARKGISDHLFQSMSKAGIHVFKDDEKFRRGEEIGIELERAINDSKIYVVVFTKDYASSAWCLRELTMMVDRRRASSAREKVILPIFYDVDPNDVKKPTGLYHTEVDKHENKHGPKIVQKWKEALSEVGGIGGWDARTINGEGKLVDLIVEDVIGKLKLRDRSLPEDLIEIDDRVDEMTKLLNLDSPDVRFVVVHGMGGIGKTTLASLVFNKISPWFTKCSFVSDVRAKSTSEEGIAKLQKKMLGDILGTKHVTVSDSNEGVGEIKRRIQGKRSLIVLDDVNKRDQIEKLAGSSEWFGPGTRIIITARDKSVVHGLVRSPIDFFEMKEMDNDHALRLFGRHAFGCDELPDEYAPLSREIAGAVRNLPLALVVIGRHLCRQSKEVWGETLRKLQQVPEKEVYEILMVSYDGLEETEQEIFLDIACFSNQVPKTELVYVWEARNLYPIRGLTALVDKSLIKIIPDDKFWMHDQLRGMGKDIVCKQGRRSPGRRSRLWDPKEAMDVIRRREGTNEIIAFNLGALSKGRCFTNEDFRGMSNLIYLQLVGGRFTGNFKNILTNLMLLHWYNIESGLDSTLLNMMNNLVVLRIWQPGPIKRLMMPNLKFLEIEDSLMTTTPDFSSSLKLEKITFHACRRLGAIHGSIGKLENLTSLMLEGCHRLRGLPEEIGRARALRELSVRMCGDDIGEHDFCLPSSINNLTSLLRLDICDTPIGKLPDAFAEMVSLESLSVIGYGVRRLPNSIWDLKFLAELCLHRTDIDGIPGSIGRLETLRVLNVSHTKIRKLPTSIGNLKKLEEFDAASCPLDEGIPKEIGGLAALITLNLQYSKLRQLPGSIGELSSLQSLYLSHSCELLELPATMCELSSLRSLQLVGCDMLQELPQLPVGLTNLEFTSTSLRLVPDLSLVMDLYNLKLRDSHYYSFGGRVPGNTVSQSQPVQLPWLGELRKLKSLELAFSRIPILLPPDMSSLTRLEILELSYTNIESLPLLPRYISSWIFANLHGTVPWARYSEMRFLHRLDLCHSVLMEIRLGGLEKLENLRNLGVKYCRELVRLSDLASLRQVRDLRLSDCPNLVDISGLERMDSVEGLHITYCESIRRIPDLLNSRRMKKLEIGWCDSLLALPNVIDECTLYIHDCRDFRDFYGPFRRYIFRARPPEVIERWYRRVFNKGRGFPIYGSSGSDFDFDDEE